MKKRITILLCVVLFVCNSIGINAEEMGALTEQISGIGIEDENIIEEKQNNLLNETLEEEVLEQAVLEDTLNDETPENLISEEKLQDKLGENATSDTCDEYSRTETTASASFDEILENEIFSEELEKSKEQNLIKNEGEIRNEKTEADYFDLCLENDDPQYGRENGYLQQSFLESENHPKSSKNYVHNSKFSNSIIRNVIDVSYYQGNIDWDKVKESGINYAFIRIGFRGYGEKGTLNVDKNFEKNIRDAIEAGISVGVYFFSQAINIKEAEEEAHFVISLLNEYRVSLPIVIDFEYAMSEKGLTGRLYDAGLSKNEMTNICKQFCNVIEKYGHQAMIYANKDMLENSLNTVELSEKYQIWLANYTNCTNYQGDYDYWQYTNCGTIEGIDGTVDISFWYKRANTVYAGVDYSAVYNYKYYIENNKDIEQAYGDNDIAVLKHFIGAGMSEGRQGIENFNVYTYRNRYADLRKVYGKNYKNYYIHYIKSGKNEGRDGSGISELVDACTVYNGIDYSLIYDYNYYIDNNPDIEKTYGDDDVAVLKHFIGAGMPEGRQGIESFNVHTYRNRYVDLRRIYGNDYKSYYLHYIKTGNKEGRDGSGVSALIGDTTYNGVDYSLVYNYSYYIENNPDIKEVYGDDDIAALKHFIGAGMSEGRQAIADFDVQMYKKRYRDLRNVYGNDLKKYYMHYIKAGKLEGRSAIEKIVNPKVTYNGVDYSLVYNYDYYIENNPDIEAVYGDDDIAVLKHFIGAGMSEGRQAIESFNVSTYKALYADLRNAYGNDLRKYYIHYMYNGIYEGRRAVDIGKILFCKIESGTDGTILVKADVKLEDFHMQNNEYYFVEVDLAGNITILATKKNGENYVEIKNALTLEEDVKSVLMGNFALAIKDSNDRMTIASDYVFISNPEALAANTTAIFKGTSKKGLQGIAYASYDGGSDIVDARNANTKHTLLNLDISTIVSSTKKSGYNAYSYKGNTYYFSDLAALRGNISSLNAGYKQYLNGNSGTTPVAVSLCLLLGYNSENSYLIDPSARTSGHSYYLMNVREEKGRETLEALFLYLGETFGQANCYVSNWILGNEINSSKAWNYGGSLDFETYMDCYATAFRLLYNGVKSTKTGNTVCISLDNGWTAAPDTYAGKTTLDAFAKKIHAMNANIDWSMAYHAYSYPLTRADFWNDYSNTTDSLSTKYISMRNIKVLTDYAGTLEKTYGKNAGTIRVLLTEQGYSHSAGAEVQAQAIARGFYIAQFNDRIDAFIIRAVVDDKDETQGKLYFGLMNRNTEKRIAFYVYEYMDSDIDKFSRVSASGTVSSENYSKFNKAKEIVCNTNWSSYVPGFNKAALANIK